MTEHIEHRAGMKVTVYEGPDHIVVLIKLTSQRTCTHALIRVFHVDHLRGTQITRSMLDVIPVWSGDVHSSTSFPITWEKVSFIRIDLLEQRDRVELFRKNPS